MGKKDKAGSMTLSDFTLYIQGDSVDTKTDRSRKQNKEPRNKPMDTQSTYLGQETRLCNKERTVSSINGVAKLEMHT